MLTDLSPAALALLKTLHVVAAVLFVGNVVVTGIWAGFFWRARGTHGFALAARAIVLTDWWFTLGGGAVLVMSGIVLAIARAFAVWGTPWIRQAIVALVLSTGLWLAVLVPAQRAMARHAPGDDDALLARAYHRWNVVGWLATVPLLYAIWCMVAKPGAV